MTCQRMHWIPKRFFRHLPRVKVVNNSAKTRDPFNPGFAELNMEVHVPERSPNTGLGHLGPVERKNTKLDRNRNKEKIEPSNRGPPERQYPEHTWNTRIGDGLTPAITTAAMDGGVKKEESEDVNPVDLVPIRKKGRVKVESPKDIPHETELKTSPMKWLHNPSAKPMVWAVMVSDAQIRQDVPQPLNSEAEMGGLMKFSERVGPIEQKGARPVESMPIKKKSGVKVEFQEEIPDMAEWDISQMKELPDGVIQTARYTQGYHEIKRNISTAVHSQSEKKLYIVPDTNVIIRDLTFVLDLIDREITGYGKPVIYISRIVWQELEKKATKGMSKGDEQDVAEKAERGLKVLKQMLQTKHLQVEEQTPEESQEAAGISWVKCNDDKILGTCLCLKQKDNGADVVLLTNDNVLIIKALVCGGDPFPTLQHSQVNAQWRQPTPIVFKSYDAPLAEKLAKLYIVPDTNVIIRDLNFVLDLIDREITGYGKPVLYIPWSVLRKLDFLKQPQTKGMPKSNLQAAARKAIRSVRDFLLETKHPPVKVQTPVESEKAAKLFSAKCNDEILKTCRHLKQKDNGACVVLLTNDSDRITEALEYNILAYKREGLLSGLENLRHKAFLITLVETLLIERFIAIDMIKNPLATSHDFKMVCHQCMDTPLPGLYQFNPTPHKCEENMLAMRNRAPGAPWVHVRERKKHREFPGKYLLCHCITYWNPKFCKYGEEQCSFALNNVEQRLWNLEKDGLFSVTEFIMQNRRI